MEDYLIYFGSLYPRLHGMGCIVSHFRTSLCCPDSPLLHHFLPHVEDGVLASLAHAVPRTLRGSGEALLDDRLDCVGVHAGENVDADADALHPLDSAEIHGLHKNFVSTGDRLQRRRVFAIEGVEHFRPELEPTAFGLNNVVSYGGELADFLGQLLEVGEQSINVFCQAPNQAADELDCLKDLLLQF